MNKHGIKTCKRVFGVTNLDDYLDCEASYNGQVVTLTKPDGTIAHQENRNPRLGALVTSAVNLWNIERLEAS